MSEGGVYEGRLLESGHPADDIEWSPPILDQYPFPEFPPISMDNDDLPQQPIEDPGGEACLVRVTAAHLENLT
jgi:hypothetical protein